MGFLRKRRRRPEIMDQPGLNPADHDRALDGLARINLVSRSAGILWPPLAALSRELGSRPLRLLDLATGAGDVPIRLWQWAKRAGLSWAVSGCDVSPVAVEHARRRAAKAGAAINFFVRDALQGPALRGYDAVTCSLFLHHLDDQEGRDLLRRMAGLAGPDGAGVAGEPARLVLVNDLVRSLSGLALAHLGTRLLSRSRIVHVDGPRSVEAAFTLGEVQALAEQAGLHGATVSRRWPCRYLLGWRRP
jgi:2-polyprenyl-3-methyl-5-hydroxy-6-metoxy-1,4-benzoquinol methylase